jgi:hypothetical protein
MKVGGLKNQGDRTTHPLQLLSVVSHTPRNVLVAWMCHIKSSVFFKTSSRHESSVPWHVSTHFPLCYKLWMFCMCSTHQPSLCIVGSSSHEPRLIKFFRFGPSSSSPRIRQIRCHTMGTPQNISWGTRSRRSARLEPQSTWDSFLLATGIPEVSKGGFYLRAKMMISYHAKVEVEEVVPEGRMLEAMPPQQQIPWRRGRPRKNKEVGENQIPSESCARSTAKELLMRVIRLEPVEATSRGSGRITRRKDAIGSNVRELTQ